MTRPLRSLLPAALLAVSLGLAACGGAAAVDGTPAAAPAEDAPAPDAPAEDAPAEGASAPDAPADDLPADDVPADDVPADPPAPASAAGDCSAAGAAVSPRPSDGLPPEVVALRDLLLDAALRCDEQLLRTAIDESDLFTYTFGEPSDAIGAWWELETAGEQPFLRMAQVLATTPALADGGEVYVWPQVTTGRPETTTDAAWAELTWLDDPAATAVDSGGYLDYRLGISTDGQWRFFVAGD